MIKGCKKSGIVLITIFMLGIQYCFPFIQSFADEAVDVNVMPCPSIDIVLAKSKTKVDVGQFEKDLKEELKRQNISQERVKINAVEAVEANIQDSFDWKMDVSPTIGSIEIANRGQNIVMKGNKKNPGKNAIWMIPEKEQEQEITFDYSVDFGDSFNAAGMLLRVKQVGNTLTGYMLSLNKSGKGWYTTAGKKYGAIWKFTYQIGTNTKNMTKTFVQGVDIATSGRLNIKSTDMQIIISGGGLKSPLTYTMDTEYGYGFGFFSDHYSHNCSKIGAFTLGNIQLITTTTKKLKEVLSNPEWREDSFRFLVNVEDYENEELQDKSELASLQTGLINEQIHPIFWGTEQNEGQANQLMEPVGGKFIDNTDYANAIKETVNYIKSLIESSKSSQYALLGEEAELKVTPESVKTGTITPEYPQGKWKVNHDEQYFENSLGQFKNSGKFMSDLVLPFDKTGRYEVLYEDGKIASRYVYVHRKPIADFSIERANQMVTLTSQSYDLDSYSKNKGIAEEKWQYKKVGEANWTAGKLSMLETDEVYIVQLRVKDFQDTWSAPTTKYVLHSNMVDSTPVASFRIMNDTTTKYEKLQVQDSSYDPAGLALTNQVWKVKKGSHVLYTGKTPLTNYENFEKGSYTMSLTVTNEAGKVSEEFSRIFQIADDTIAPEVVGSTLDSGWTNQPVIVDLKLTDKGGSGVKGYQYAITDSQEVPTVWSQMIAKENDSIIMDKEGEKYLHVIGHDHAGNVSSDTVFGPYKIDLSKPQVDSIVPENKDWTNESIVIKVAFSDKGGSGLLGYEYAITTSKETPENWSEKIQEDTAEFTISGEAKYYLHLKMYDKAGNTSEENVYGPYEIDKTSPQVEVKPAFSDWSNQPIVVDVAVVDEGGSGLQKYQYTITDQGTMPEKWENEVVGSSKPIVIDSEGEHYLHIMGQDYAGNESKNFIFGKYKLDFTLPELIQDSQINSDTKVSSIKFTANDKLSGVSQFKVNGTVISGTEYRVTKNGEYQFEILDEAGNQLIKNLTIHNVYAECDKKMGHPDYNSSNEKCPICDLIEGIKVTTSEKIYEGAAIGISYTNEKKAEVVEYYEDELEKPSIVGNYEYALKVVYEQKEYETGITGIFSIDKKPIAITGLKLADKKEDGIAEVSIDKSNMRVEGIVEQDKQYVKPEIVDKAKLDSASAGEKTVVLKKDEDYRLKGQESEESSYEEIVNCYELPETITLTGKVAIHTNQNMDSNTTEDKKDTQNQLEVQQTDKKTNQKKEPSKLVYTGGGFESSVLVIVCMVVVLNRIVRKSGKETKKSRIERMLK